MDNIIHIERVCTICGERSMFRDLINNCSKKNENLKLKGSLCVLLPLLFSSPSILLGFFSETATQNYSPKWLF